MVYFLIIFFTFFTMEGVTWLTHKYVMHGFLWYLHRDHHDHEHEGALEKNDYFFIIFAFPAAYLVITGLNDPALWYLAPIGIGITLYGLAYFLVHDIFIHQRLKIFRNAENWYLKGIRRAHKQHHKHINKEDGECFGFLYVPIKYFKMYMK